LRNDIDWEWKKINEAEKIKRDLEIKQSDLSKEFNPELKNLSDRIKEITLHLGKLKIDFDDKNEKL